LDGPTGKHGIVYAKHYGFCLETQYHSDAPNHAEFPSIRIAPDLPYKEATTYKFAVLL
jgi:aldose 1-epimerase